jgi:hypothetical protein
MTDTDPTSTGVLTDSYTATATELYCGETFPATYICPTDDTYSFTDTGTGLSTAIITIVETVTYTATATGTASIVTDSYTTTATATGT